DDGGCPRARRAGTRRGRHNGRRRGSPSASRRNSHRFHVGDADDDVADLLWRGALVIGGRLVDATGCAGCVETERLNFELDTLGEAEGDGVAGIIDRVERAAALGADVAVARELFADG